MSSTTNYDDRDPPAPIARVALSKPGSDARIDGLLMLIDSGADATILPRGVASDLGAGDATRYYEVEGYGGAHRQLPVVDAVLRVSRFTFSGSYMIDETRDVGVLGRDVLNQLILELNGPLLFGTCERSEGARRRASIA